jgi:alpha-ketoglutarate-dependent 2,4-dichlorophenoxyacetate dioxygenase
VREQLESKTPPTVQPLVRTHPDTGAKAVWFHKGKTERRSLFLSSHAGAIVGWPLPEARLLLRDLTEHATQREFVYSHQWQVNDLVMWDNRQTMHRGRAFPAGEPRDVRRTTLKGDGTTVEQGVAA